MKTIIALNPSTVRALATRNYMWNTFKPKCEGCVNGIKPPSWCSPDAVCKRGANTPPNTPPHPPPLTAQQGSPGLFDTLSGFYIHCFWSSIIWYDYIHNTNRIKRSKVFFSLFLLSVCFDWVFYILNNILASKLTNYYNCF